LARGLLSGGTEGRPSDYLDLESPSDLEKLSDPVGYLRSRADRLVVLDEVQRVPELFRALRGLIDERLAKGDRAGLFLLLGSASLDLQRHTSENLAGRLATLELGGLHVLEVDAAERDLLWGSRTPLTASCTTRSSTLGIPSPRSPPPDLGIQTRRMSPGL